MPKPLMLIINPAAGKGAVRYHLYGILTEFSRAGYSTHVYMTQKHRDATELAAQYGSDYELLVCIGGDGTLSETTAGIMRLPPERRPDIGYIPMGTANDVSSTLGLSHNGREGALKVLYGEKHLMDVGSLNGESFNYIAAFGSFTEISYSTPQDKKRVLGHLAYVLEGLASITREITAHKAHIVYDGGELDGEFLFGAVTNSTSVAGLVRLDETAVNLSDGYFETLLVRKPTSPADMNSIVSGILSKNYDPETVIFLHSRRVSFTFSEPVAWTRDGEAGGLHSSVTAENLHEAVTIIY